MKKQVERLAKTQDFSACYTRGRVYKGRFVVVHTSRNGKDISRVGFSVSKKLGKAVTRNRVKRRLREIIREFEGNLPTGYDLVVAARVAAVDAPFSQLRAGVAEVLQRAGMLPRAKTDSTDCKPGS